MKNIRLAPLALLALGLAGCGTPAPPPQLYQLRAAPPVAVQAAPAVGPAVAHAVQLLLPVAIPELLERDTLIVSTGQAGVQALAGHRWAEPLRDAVPRLLRQDLAALLGNGRVWVAPLPAGVTVQRLLRVELLVLQADAARSAVHLQARWTVSGAATTATTPATPATAATAPPPLPTVSTQLETFSVAISGPDVDALVTAHRLALWRLAERLSAAGALRP